MNTAIGTPIPDLPVRSLTGLLAEAEISLSKS